MDARRMGRTLKPARVRIPPMTDSMTSPAPFPKRIAPRSSTLGLDRPEPQHNPFVDPEPAPTGLRAEVEQLRGGIADLEERLNALAEEARANALRTASVHSQLLGLVARLNETETTLSAVDGVLTDTVVQLADTVARQRAGAEELLQETTQQLERRLRDHAVEMAANIADAADSLRTEQYESLSDAVRVLIRRIDALEANV